MTPETKAWIVKIKEQYFHKSDKNPTSIFDIPPFVGLEEEALFNAIQIIESQEKEIERLKAQLKEGIEIMRAAGGFFEKIIGNENQKIKV